MNKSKISFFRLLILQKQFKYNYQTLAEQYFNNMTPETRDLLLASELDFDKEIVLATISENFIWNTPKNLLYYIWVKSFDELNDCPKLQSHLVHNAQRTIAASLLNASEQEKIEILSYNCKRSQSAPYLPDIAKDRISNFYEICNHGNSQKNIIKPHYNI